MGLLGEIYSFGNRTRNKLRGLLDDPKGYLQQTADQTANTLRDMTGANETAQQFALRDKINAGDKNALEQYRNLEKTIQNKLFDVALNFNPAAVGMFIGKGAKTWDSVAAAEAEKRLAAGDDARKVWSELGVFRGPDGHLRQEISDSNSIPGHRLYSWGEAEDLKQSGSSAVRRQKALLHPDLSAAYPDTKNLGVILKTGKDGGSYDVDWRSITVGAGQNGAANRSTMLHELQHVIQDGEGWASGGSPAQMAKEIKSVEQTISSYNNALRDTAKRMDEANKIGDKASLKSLEESYRGLMDKKLSLVKEANIDPYDAYRRLAGEAEARATQARMNMDMAQRRATFPLDSYDVPVNQLIIRGGLLE